MSDVCSNLTLPFFSVLKRCKSFCFFENIDKVEYSNDEQVIIMEDLLRLKLEQNPYVKKKLLQTGDYLIVEDSPKDDFWGWGPNRDGNNQLGKLWMKLREELDEVLATLTEREERVLRLRFGLIDGRQRTLEEVGKEFNVTRERIRQIEAKALRKLKHPSRSKKLKDFMIKH